MPSLLSQLTSGTFPTDRTEFFRAHIRPDGHAWSFAGHEYLEAIVADTSREIVLRKAAQLGLSTWAMGVLLHDCSQGRSAGYYLSDRDFMRAFVQDKFDPLCNADEALASITMEGQASEGVAAAARARRKSADNLRIKKIGHGTAWFQGLQKLKDAKSISLDTIIKDELNELDPQFVPWLADRLLHSSYKHMISLSQCSVPEYGIDAEFLASDQKFFLLQCARCRRWCNLIEDWPDCLVEHHPGPARAGRRLSPPSSPARKRPQGGRAAGRGGQGGRGVRTPSVVSPVPYKGSDRSPLIVPPAIAAFASSETSAYAICAIAPPPSRTGSPVPNTIRSAPKRSHTASMPRCTWYVQLSICSVSCFSHSGYITRSARYETPSTMTCSLGNAASTPATSLQLVSAMSTCTGTWSASSAPSRSPQHHGVSSKLCVRGNSRTAPC